MYYHGCTFTYIIDKDKYGKMQFMEIKYNVVI